MDIIEVTQVLGNLGEFTGAVAVVVTLFYLASQIRQTNENIKAQTRANYHTTHSDVWSMAAENRQLADVLSKELGGQSLTRPEFIQLAAYFTKDLLANQWTYLGLSDEDSASSLRYLKGSFHQFPTLRWVQANRRHFFQADFVEYLERNIIDHLEDRSIPEFPAK